MQVLGSRPFRTDGDVVALKFAADGNLWSVEEPGVLRHWDGGTGRQIAWHPLTRRALLWEFSADARRAVSAGEELTVWDVASGRPAAVLAQSSWITALAFSPDAALVATGHDDGMVRLWDVARCRLADEWLAHPGPLSALAFSREGTRLASAGEDRTICLWRAPGGQLATALSGHTDRIPALAWHPGGGRLYSAGWDTTVRVWDTASGEPVILLNTHATQVTGLAVNRAGSRLASADSARALHFWAIPANRELYVTESAGEVRALAFSPDGEALASGGADRVIRLWCGLHDGDPIHGRPGVMSEPFAAGRPEAKPAAPRDCIATSPDGKLLAGSELPGQLEDAGELRAVACSPDGRWIAGSDGPREVSEPVRDDGDGFLRLWDASTGRLHRSLVGPRQAVTALAFSRDAALLASASNRGTDVWIWDVRSGAPALLLPEAIDGCSVGAVAFHPQRRWLAAGGLDWLATGGSDGAVVVWDVEDRREVVTLNGAATALAFDPSGRRLAAALLDGRIGLWDVAQWEGGGVRRCPEAELHGHEEPASSLAYSPDGRLLASGGTDHALCLWDAAAGTLLASVRLDAQVKALWFAPDGHTLFSRNGTGCCCRLGVPQMLAGGVSAAGR